MFYEHISIGYENVISKCSPNGQNFKFFKRFIKRYGNFPFYDFANIEI